MRLTTLITADGPCVGVGDDDVVRLLDAGPILLDVVRGGDEALADVARRARTARVVPLADAVFGPLLDPPTLRDFLTYERHLAALAGSVPHSWYEEPLLLQPGRDRRACGDLSPVGSAFQPDRVGARQGRLEDVREVLTAWDGPSRAVINANAFANDYLQFSPIIRDDRSTSTPVLISGNDCH